MICPHDDTQMVQKAHQGGGVSERSKYITWEVKVCPQCDRERVQLYAEIPVSTQNAYQFGKELQTEIEEFISSLYKEM